MAMESNSSTDEYKLNKFKSHGRAEFERQGQILICHATGPFNKELVLALATVEPKLQAIISDGNWADITVLKGSALATPDALSTLSEYLKSLTEQGVISCASALVITEQTEGFRFTIPHIINAFADTGTELKLFKNLEEAKAWTLNKLNLANQN